MSAGRGIRHSEYNASQTEPLHLLQLWIFPRHNGLEPRWEQRVFTAQERDGQLLPAVSGGDLPETLTIDQDAGVYLSRLASGKKAAHQSRPGRKAYLFVISGEVMVNGHKLGAGDQARIADEKELAIESAKVSELILLDLPD